MGTVKYSGPVASFHCPTNAEIRSLKVHFSPKQEGEGDPSPENVREIVGWDGVVVHNDDGNVVPQEYQKVEYIQTPNGGTYIDSGIVMSLDLVFEIAFQLTETTKGRYFMGEYAGGSFYLYTGIGTNIVFQTAFGAPWQNTTLLVDTNRHRFMYSFSNGRTTVKDGNDVIWDRAIVNLSDRNILVAGTPTQSSSIPVKTFSSKMIKSGIVIQNLIPCRRKSDNKPGMYDTVSGEFFTNQGTGEFICGPDVGETVEYEFGTLGKNKFDYTSTTFIQGIRGNDGEFISDSVSHYTEQFIPVIPATEYTLSGNNLYSGGYVVRIYYSDANKNWISKTSGDRTNALTFTTPSNCYYIQIQTNSNGTNPETWQLELGSTATAYEPYNPNKTVYGGWVDLITGEVCEEYGLFVPDENSYITVISGNTYKQFRFQTAPTILNRNNGFCTHFTMTANPNIYGKTGMDWLNLACQLILQEDSSIYMTTVDELKNWLVTQRENGTPFQIVYQAATPNTYQLAPTQLTTFLSTNNIWSNADYVEVEYDLHETQTILARKQFIVANQPHIVKPAAAPLQNFVTDVAAPLKECKVYFNPVQDTSNGAPSPDNICPISGWTGCEVYRTGKNLLNEVFLADYSNYPIQGNYGYRYTEPIFLKPNTQYVFSFTTTQLYETVRYWAVKAYDDAYDDINNSGAIRYLVNGKYSANQSITTGAKGAIRFATYGGQTTLDDIWNNTTVQLELGSTATSYEPYSGTTIPISFPSVTNILNSTTITTNKTLSAAGEETSETGMSVTNYIKVNEGDTYKLTFTSKEGARTRRIYGYDANKDPIESLASASWVSVDTTGSIQATIPSGVEYIRICYKTADENIFLEGPESSVIYGGYVDLVTGEVWKTWDYVALDTLQWETFGGNGVFYNSSIRRKAGNPIYSNILTPTLTPGSNYTAVDPTQVFYYKTNTTYKNYLMTRNSDFSGNLNGYRQWMKDTYPGAIAFYELETPILLATLTPTQLKALRGTNNVYSNSNGNLEVAYWTH